jgi:SAM-dependent methyltransferase
VKESDIRKKEAFDRYLELLEEDTLRLFDPSQFEHMLCPACGADSPSPQFEKMGFQYVTCDECNTLYADPRPGLDDLVSFYADSPSTTYWVNEFFMPVAEKRRELIFRPRAEHICESIDLDSDSVVGDIGAGFGIFLEEMAAVSDVSNLIAIEPSVEQADICRSKGLDVHACALEELEGRDGQFDLLTAFELFEHLHDPLTFLTYALQLLKPGGRLLMTTLNGEGFDISVLWEDSKAVSPPGHLNFCNPTSIVRLLERAGFEVEEVATPGRLDWDIVERSAEDGVDIGRLWTVFAERASDEAKAQLQEWIAEHRMSSHMRVVARRPR